MAQDIFIKIGTFKGESQDEKFKEWIDVLAWSWSASQTGDFHGGGGGGAGKVNVNDFSFTKYVDLASTKALESLCKGTHVKCIEVKARKAGDKPFVYMEYLFEDCILSSYSTGGSGGEDKITENIGFNFARFKFKYSQQKKDGGLEGDSTIGYDVQKNAVWK